MTIASPNVASIGSVEDPVSTAKSMQLSSESKEQKSEFENGPETNRFTRRPVQIYYDIRYLTQCILSYFTHVQFLHRSHNYLQYHICLPKCVH